MQKLLLAILVITGCSSPKETTNKERKLDTIYAGNYFKDKGWESKKLTVLIDNGKDSESPVFKFKKETLVRVRVPRLNKYPLFPSEIIGADILKVDTSNNHFIVIPKDSLIKFTLNQDYGKDNVIIILKDSIEEKVIPQNGFKRLSSLEFKTIIKE